MLNVSTKTNFQTNAFVHGVQTPLHCPCVMIFLTSLTPHDGPSCFAVHVTFFRLYTIWRDLRCPVFADTFLYFLDSSKPPYYMSLKLMNFII